jgi:hypothetical protein
MDREWAWVLLIQWAALWDQTLQEAPAWAPSWVLALPPMSDDFLARVSLAPLNSLKVGKGYCRQSLGRRNRYLEKTHGTAEQLQMPAGSFRSIMQIRSYTFSSHSLSNY